MKLKIPSVVDIPRGFLYIYGVNIFELYFLTHDCVFNVNTQNDNVICITGRGRKIDDISMPLIIAYDAECKHLAVTQMGLGCGKIEFSRTIGYCFQRELQSPVLRRRKCEISQTCFDFGIIADDKEGDGIVIIRNQVDMVSGGLEKRMGDVLRRGDAGP